MKPYIAGQKILRAMALVATLALPAAFTAGNTARAADAPANKLESVDVQSGAGRRLEVVLKLSGPAASCTFTKLTARAMGMVMVADELPAFQLTESNTQEQLTMLPTRL